MTSYNLYCQLLIDIAVRHGVKSVYCSPGSRNAPLLLAAAGNEELQKRVVVDERSAAFMALGEALVSRRPVMLICTSGTALLNYAPAVAEAFYAGIPLIVVSADRPVQWIDQDDSQTINQFEALAPVVKQSYDLPVFLPELGNKGEELRWFVDRSVNDALITALRPKKGPVHINVRLDVPLGKCIPGSGEQGRFIEFVAGPGDLPLEQTKELAAVAVESRVLLLCGFMPPDSAMFRSVNGFAELSGNIAVMAESIANVDSGGELKFCMVDSLLSRLDEDSLKRLSPDLVITVGGAVVSRMVKEWLRKYPPKYHWSVGYQHTTVDCLKSLTARIETSPSRFLRQLSIRMKKLLRSREGMSRQNTTDFQYRDEITRLRNRALAFRNRFVDDVPWTDLKAFSIIAASFPKDMNLFLSNGTPIRYAQLFDIPAHACYCNRGVSGIDGCTSTAIGGATAFSGNLPGWDSQRRSTILITGDMSFSYDLSALSWPGFPDSLKIIVINNSGGGIFRFIRSTSSLDEEMLGKYFCVPPGIDIEKFSSSFGFNYLKAENESELNAALPRLYSSERAAVLEIVTPAELSAAALSQYLSRT